MKPNQQQQQWLQDYLYQVMVYRETYEEVHDHILIALEYKPEEKFFESTVNSIMADDFGDLDSLLSMEENCKDAMNKEVIKQYRSYFNVFFRFPPILYTAVIFTVIYYIAIHINILIVSMLFIATLGIPILLLTIRTFRTGYTFDSRKLSLRDGIFRDIAYKPFYYCLLFHVLSSSFGLLSSAIQTIVRFIFHYDIVLKVIVPKNTYGVGYVLLTIVWTLAVIHIVSLLKLYRNEFKISLTS